MSKDPRGEAESPRGFGAACQALGLSPPFRGKILSHPISSVLLPAPAVLPASPHAAQGVPCPLSSLPGERPGSLSGSACLLLPHSLWRWYLTGTGDNRFQEANSQQVRHPLSPAGAATTQRAWSAGFSSAARSGEAWNLIFSSLRPVLFLLSLATSCKKHGLLLGQMRKLRPREGKDFPGPPYVLNQSHVQVSLTVLLTCPAQAGLVRGHGKGRWPRVVNLFPQNISQRSEEHAVPGQLPGPQHALPPRAADGEDLPGLSASRGAGAARSLLAGGLTGHPALGCRTWSNAAGTSPTGSLLSCTAASCTAPRRRCMSHPPSPALPRLSSILSPACLSPAALLGGFWVPFL